MSNYKIGHLLLWCTNYHTINVSHNTWTILCKQCSNKFIGCAYAPQQAIFYPQSQERWSLGSFHATKIQVYLNVECIQSLSKSCDPVNNFRFYYILWHKNKINFPEASILYIVFYFVVLFPKLDNLWLVKLQGQSNLHKVPTTLSHHYGGLLGPPHKFTDMTQ